MSESAGKGERGPDCRLCGGETEQQFRLTVRDRFDVGYHECRRCGSLQTDAPTWLGEAYADHRRTLDTGNAQRCISSQVLVYWALRIAGLDPRCKAIDWGGGDGLTVRMMRDIGVDAFLADKYAENIYAIGFDAGDADTAALLTAFEVFEHFAQPGEEVERLFSRSPELFLVSTSQYRGQGHDWVYLYPHEGQHVFFWSAGGMQFVAEKYGYDVLTSPLRAAFVKRRLGPVRRRLLQALINKPTSRWFHVPFVMMPKRGRIMSDREMLSPSR